MRSPTLPSPTARRPASPARTPAAAHGRGRQADRSPGLARGQAAAPVGVDPSVTPSGAANPPRPAAVRAIGGPASRHAELAPAERRGLVACVTGLHLLLLWGLLQVGAVRHTLHPVAPLMLDFIAVEAPPRPSPPPPQPQPPTVQRALPMQPAPLPVAAAAPQPDAAPAPQAVAMSEPVPVPAAPATAAAPAPVTAPAPPQPAPPKPVSASALRYAVLPPVELPLASRRLGESGTVLLRVVFDTQGRVSLVSVQRSSGFARLDEQALAAMHQARIQPFLENGQAIEVSALAPLAYELD